MKSYWKFLNLNPSGGIAPDCTTRTLAFCLGKDYSEIKEHQIKISLAVSGRKSHWNAFYVLECILINSNWTRLVLVNKIVRRKLVEILEKVPVKVMTESYEHVSPIYKGKIYDTWDCSGGRVNTLMFPLEKSKKVLRKLDENNVQYVLD